MALKAWLSTWLLLAMVWPLMAAAENAPSTEAAKFVPPQAIGATSIIYPKEAPPHAETITVIVSILIDTQGEVDEVKLLQTGGSVFDLAVLTGAASFTFKPALFENKPQAVNIRYTANFPPPAIKKTKPEPIAPKAELRGEVQERGTRMAITDGQVTATNNTQQVHRTLIEDGAFTFKLAPGVWNIAIKAPGFKPFTFQETLKEEALVVRCLVERQSYSDYEELVIGKRTKIEVSRTSLRGREIHRVPGTFGDPYKVTNAMPGVSQLMSLMPLPVIRGVGPSQSGFLLDGIALPLFYHSLAGPSVIHPQFVERIDFSPGTPSIEYGGYTGGIINGVSTLPFQNKKSSYDINLNLIQGGGLVRENFESINTEVMAAARIGYPNGILSLLNSPARLSYWDYQTRVAYGDRNLFVSAMFFGARDNLETLEDQYVNNERIEVATPTFYAEFHKIVLRARHQSPTLIGDYQVALSYDLSAIDSADPAAKSLGIAPKINWQWQLLDSLKLMTGISADFRELKLMDSFQAEADNPLHSFLTLAADGLHKDAGSWLGFHYQPLDAWLITPGIRVDLYSDPEISHWAVQPRIQTRVRLYQSEDEDQHLWLKAATGIYHQPPRPYFTLPGLSATALDLGLLRSHQNMMGVEWQIDSAWHLDIQTYYNILDPTVFELNLTANNEEPSPTRPNQPNQPPDPQQEEWLTGLSGQSKGRAYGIEVMLRKSEGERFFGWLSYALARSERLNNGEYQAYDFDRTHTMNLVGGMKFARNWELGGRLVFQTGSPLETREGGFASGRSAPNWRVDLRMDKRVVFNEWLLDFYIEILNIAVTNESGGLIGKEGFRYVLPTLGLRAIL